jgi:Protein of unknown function (DUF2845)
MKAALLLITILCVPSLARAESVSCGGRIITRGSSSAELASFCGDPAQVNKPSSDFDQIQVEIWTYNFGPNQLMQRVRIENGVVVQIDSLGYGYNQP